MIRKKVLCFNNLFSHLSASRSLRSLDRPGGGSFGDSVSLPLSLACRPDGEAFESGERTESAKGTLSALRAGLRQQAILREHSCLTLASRRGQECCTVRYP